MDDLISRQEAIDAIMEEPTDAHYPCWYKDKIEKIPSADRPTGEWIEVDNNHCKCPFCHKEWSYFENMVEFFDYCPRCGAKLE